MQNASPGGEEALAHTPEPEAPPGPHVPAHHLLRRTEAAMNTPAAYNSGVDTATRPRRGNRRGLGGTASTGCLDKRQLRSTRAGSTADSFSRPNRSAGTTGLSGAARSTMSMSRRGKEFSTQPAWEIKALPSPYIGATVALEQERAELERQSIHSAQARRKAWKKGALPQLAKAPLGGDMSKSVGALPAADFSATSNNMKRESRVVVAQEASQLAQQHGYRAVADMCSGGRKSVAPVAAWADSPEMMRTSASSRRVPWVAS